MKSLYFAMLGLAVTSLAGCQTTTGSDGYETLRTFADGWGVVRARGAADGQRATLTAIAPNAARYDGSSIDDGVPINIDANSAVITGYDANGTFYEATGYVGASPLYIAGYETDNGQASILYGVDINTGDSALMAGGMEATSIPAAGSAIYNGASVVGSRWDSSFQEIGTFAMNVNFGTQKASISANTANTSLFGTDIDVNGDELSSRDLTLTVFGTQYRARLDGFLNGPGANAVTGVFHDDRADPFFGGAFAGQD